MGAKEKILQAATQLFAGKSYAMVGIREIAKHAEVNSAMVSYYFGGKHGILREIYQMFIERHRQIFCQSLEQAQDIEGFYRQFIRNIINDFREQAAVYTVCLSEFSNDIPEVRDLKEQFATETSALNANMSVKFQVDLSQFTFLKEAIGPVSLLNSALGMLIFKRASSSTQSSELNEAFYEAYTNIISELMLHGMMGVLKYREQ